MSCGFRSYTAKCEASVNPCEHAPGVLGFVLKTAEGLNGVKSAAREREGQENAFEP